MTKAPNKRYLLVGLFNKKKPKLQLSKKSFSFQVKKNSNRIKFFMWNKWLNHDNLVIQACRYIYIFVHNVNDVRQWVYIKHEMWYGKQDNILLHSIRYSIREWEWFQNNAKKTTKNIRKCLTIQFFMAQFWTFLINPFS